MRISPLFTSHFGMEGERREAFKHGSGQTIFRLTFLSCRSKAQPRRNAVVSREETIKIVVKVARSSRSVKRAGRSLGTWILFHWKAKCIYIILCVNRRSFHACCVTRKNLTKEKINKLERIDGRGKKDHSKVNDKGILLESCA